MPGPARGDLERALAAFIRERRGLRQRAVFGDAAGFAGRHMFARVSARGLAVRLPPEAFQREMRGGAREAGRPGRGGRGASRWVVLGSAQLRNGARLERVLEEAATHAAELAGEPGVRPDRR